jgi:hypothetical protein
MRTTTTTTITITTMMILLMALLLTYTMSSVTSFSIPPTTTTTITITSTPTPTPTLSQLQQWNSNSFFSSSSGSSSCCSSCCSSRSSKHSSSSSSSALLLADGVTSSEAGSISASNSNNSNNNNSSNSSNNKNALQQAQIIGTNKLSFLNSLDTTDTLNDATKERTELLNKMINEKIIVNVKESSNNNNNEHQEDGLIKIIPTISYDNPGSSETFLSSSSTEIKATSSYASNTETTSSTPTKSAMAAGKWKVIYAPHISTAANLINGKFDVEYNLFDDKDSTIVSHAYYDFPIIGKGYLSVSGTYGSVLKETKSNNEEQTTTATATTTGYEYYSKVDFNKAWIKPIQSQSESESQKQKQPYESLYDVPDSIIKTLINEIGKRSFVESVAIFPVSFLDSNMIVFEFQLFGTKICAYKVQ